MKRVLIHSKEARMHFFQRVLETHNLNNWMALYHKLGKSRKTMENYRSGRLTIPMGLYLQLTENFSSEEIEKFTSKMELLDDKWGCVKGGKITYARHKEIFEKGREILYALNKEKAPSKINDTMPVSEGLAYFIGLHIGDGFADKYDHSYIVQFTGNKLDEDRFYEEKIKSLVKELFNMDLKIKHETKTNTLRANLYSRDVFRLITQRFKIKAGKKSDIVTIPDEITNSTKNIICACIAGIYDAECNVFFDERPIYKEPYPRLDLHMHNTTIIKQISKILTDFEIPHSVTKDLNWIYVYGKEDINQFVNNIHMKNYKNLEKLEPIVIV